jgi:hypothetical protein
MARVDAGDNIRCVLMTCPWVSPAVGLVADPWMHPDVSSLQRLVLFR